MDLDYIYDILKQKNYIDNDKIVPRELLENLFNAKAADSITWKGPIMQLMEYLKKKGYFSTTRKVPLGCLRIMKANEYAKKVKNGVQSGLNKNKLNLTTLQKCDRSELNDRELKELLHSQNVVIMSLHSAKSILFDL
jgi:hypothetical protein